MIHTTFNGVRAFAHEHDDIPAFHAAYLVATFLAAAILNLGFFLGLILLHMALDFIKYRDIHKESYRLTFRAMILESISDIAFFLLALTFAVYFSHTFLLAAASGLVRSELTVLRALGTLIPKVAIFEHMVTVMVSMHSYLHTEVEGIHGPMTRVQVWSLRVSTACTGLLLLSVFLYWQGGADLVPVLLRELVPAL
jgi:hypothetical protein